MKPLTMRLHVDLAREMRVKQHRVLMPRCVRDSDSLCSKGFQKRYKRACIQDLIALILHLEGLSDLEPMPPECRKDIALVIVECFPDSTENGIDIQPIDLPVSNVLLYELGGDKGLDWACARPSGTEPKLKIYFGVYDKDEKTASDRLESIKAEMSAFVENKLG